MQSFTLLTDLYQLTMAYGYWRLNLHERKANFHLLYRNNPFQGSYALTCGLDNVIDYLQHFQFTEDDLSYLKTLSIGDEDFLNYLRNMRFSCDVDAIPEGTIVSPHEPLLRIQGPLLQCQLLESPLLNILNFQTLIATKASRIYHAAGGDSVMEFGLRRAQGPDGALSASRAAYIGGCESTSNTLAGKKYDIPVIGTHAHSWVTAFSDELNAFKAYAEVMPNQMTLLVDTYVTLQGVKNAIEINKTTPLAAIRLDSGDLSTLSKKARKMLDEAGLTQTKIIASNNLDEYVIQKLKAEGACISAWGVGTHLVTASDCPALDGVYKLSALQNKEGEWEYKLKISEDAIKTSHPGIHQIRRFYENNKIAQDVIYDVTIGIADYPQYTSFKDLLVPIFRQGKCVFPKETIHSIRERAIKNSTDFWEIMEEKKYKVTLEEKLHQKKQQLIADIRARNKV